MIEVRGITKRYGAVKVLDGVSLKMERGKITSIIGSNGAGKTTLLGIVSRLIKPDEGTVLLDGRELRAWEANELARTISILKQSNHLNIRLTIRELVSFGRFPYSQGRLNKEDWAAVDQAIEHLKLRDIQEKQLDRLSGGQRQRAFIAMVVAQDTEYVLLDEPLNSLDMKHSVEMMRVLQSLAHDLGKTVIVVLHDINFASCYSDEIIALKDGKLARQGTVDEIVREDVIESIFEMKLRIEEIENRKICVYF
jgi:iron complex transport system ATP-binding protein